MNKYQEALDFITDHTHPMCETMKDLESLDFSYNILQELVDKETPMKPVKEKNSEEYFRNCPKCGDPVYIDDWNAYLHRCEYCGQKIDWNEDEKDYVNVTAKIAELKI